MTDTTPVLEGADRPQRRLSLRSREALNGYLMISPWLLGFVIFTAGPMIYSAYLMFTNWDLISAPQFVGLQNFVSLVQDSEFRAVLENTFVYGIIVVPFQLAIALGVALLLNSSVIGTSVFRVACFLPSQVPFVASAVLWLVIFSPQFGLANNVLSIFHIPPQQWLANPNLVKPALAVVGIWGFGNFMVIFLAGLQTIPSHLQEAAEIDGAGPLSRFRNVTIPMLSPTIFFNVVVSIIGAIQAFVPMYVMTNGGPGTSSLTAVLYIYQVGFQNFDMGYASVLSWVLFVFILILTAIQFRVARRWVYYEV